MRLCGKNIPVDEIQEKEYPNEYPSIKSEEVETPRQSLRFPCPYCEKN
jgi:hypothetical protein